MKAKVMSSDMQEKFVINILCAPATQLLDQPYRKEP